MFLNSPPPPAPVSKVPLPPALMAVVRKPFAQRTQADKDLVLRALQAKAISPAMVFGPAAHSGLSGLIGQLDMGSWRRLRQQATEQKLAPSSPYAQTPAAAPTPAATTEPLGSEPERRIRELQEEARQHEMKAADCRRRIDDIKANLSRTYWGLDQDGK